MADVDDRAHDTVLLAGAMGTQILSEKRPHANGTECVRLQSR
ncbi:hypothetical protein QGN32_22420 [Mycolicibacterium sp. ND9-15]|nr:hypothetical protein [Mycolicibacterium sp. ND9-15]WSE56071.1 hypothetical protein QGN32_22420 [Mycolicibacterium sp. ND9-15]